METMKKNAIDYIHKFLYNDTDSVSTDNEKRRKEVENDTYDDSHEVDALKKEVEELKKKLNNEYGTITNSENDGKEDENGNSDTDL